MERINAQNRSFINAFIMEHWYSTKMIVRGKEIDMTTTEGFFVFEDEKIIGLITYVVSDDILEVMSLDSLRENQGIGTELLQTVIEEAKSLACRKIVLITTNDNINALRFYQKRGFDMVHLFHNALDVSRKIKPEIPLVGDNSIPLKHEIEFEMVL